MCSGLNHKRIAAIQEESREDEQIKKIEAKLKLAFENRSHTKALSENEK